MNTKTPPDARPPFTLRNGFVFDADDSRVICCSQDDGCPRLWKEEAVDADPHFMCPDCGRLGQRMDELRQLPQCAEQPAIAKLCEATWNAAYPDRRPWSEINAEAQREWVRVFQIFAGLLTRTSPCPTCGGCWMLPGTGPDDDVMNTPCPDCNEWAEKTRDLAAAQVAVDAMCRHHRQERLRAFVWDLSTGSIPAADIRRLATRLLNELRDEEAKEADE